VAQVWSTDDDFAHGLPVYGTNLAGYIGAQPSTTEFSYGILHDGYPGSGVAFAGRDGAAAKTASCAVMRREVFPADVAVSVKVHISGTSDSTKMGRTGVLARVQGGSLADDGTVDVRYTGVTAYEWSAVSTAAGGGFIYFVLQKWVGGVGQVLATVPLALTGIDLTGTFGLLLQVVTFGSPSLAVVVGSLTDVRIDGVDHSFAPYNLATHYDLSGSSPILGDGRCGFLMPREIELSGEQVVQRADVFEVHDQVVGVTAPGTTLLRDEFTRLNSPASFLVTDDFAVSGRSVQSDFMYDQHAATEATDLGITYPDEWFVRDTAAERVYFEAPSTAGVFEAFALSQRPADDVRSQHRTVNIEFDTGGSHVGSPILQAGIVLRASKQAQALGFFGYAAVAQIDGAGHDRSIVLMRGNGNVGGVLAATAVLATADATGLFTPGTAFELEVEVFAQQGGPDPDEAPAVIEVKLNGATVPLVVQPSQAAEISVDGSGVVTDSGQYRVLQGFGEGLATLATGTTRRVYLDTWEQDTLTVPAGAPRDQASIAVSTEGAAVGSLGDVLTGDWPVTITRPSDVVSTTFESGHGQTFPINGQDRRQFQFAKRGATEAEVDALVAFWDGHAGPVVPFSWEPAEGEAFTVRFVPDSLEYTEDALGSFSTTFQLQEVF
jgi:hypothetical protein